MKLSIAFRCFLMAELSIWTANQAVAFTAVPPRTNALVMRPLTASTKIFSQQGESPSVDAPENPKQQLQRIPEPNSHQELMYALGVNLARQLGDIRPVVEDGDELAQVAKGLLDTVVGRLTEEDQKALLAARGKDLNVLISDRA